MAEKTIFCRRTLGGLKGQNEGFGGSSLIKERNFHLPYFGIMFERGLSFFEGWKGLPKKHDYYQVIRLGSGKFFASKTFSAPLRLK